MVILRPNEFDFHFQLAFKPTILLVLIAGCAQPGGNGVQDPSNQSPSWFVSVSAADGFSPECKAIDAQDTVQWQNQDPSIPANVTLSISETLPGETNRSIIA